jgi:hypothetical protein
MGALWLVCIVFPAIVAAMHVARQHKRRKRRAQLPHARVVR